MAEEENNKKLLPKDQQNLANAAKAASAKDYGGSDNPTLEGLKNFSKDAVSGTLDVTKEIAKNAAMQFGLGAGGGVVTSPLSKVPVLGRIPRVLKGVAGTRALIAEASATGGFRLGQEFEEQYRDTPVLDNPLVRGMQNAAGTFVSNLPFIKPDQPNVLSPDQMKAQLDLNDARAKARAEGTEMPLNKGEFSEQPSLGLNGYTPFNIRAGGNAPAPAQTEAPAPTEAPVAPAVPTPSGLSNQFEGSALMRDGSTKGKLSDGTSRTMTPEEIDSFEKARVAGTANEYSKPMGEYQDVEGTQGSVQLPLSSTLQPKISQEQLTQQFDEMRKSGLSTAEKEQKSKELMANYFASQNADSPTLSGGSGKPKMNDLEAKMRVDFKDFKESGKEMTPEMENKASLLANSVGRTFDPETGYSEEFSPEIMRIYQEGVKDGVIDPASLGRESQLDVVNRERNERQEQSKREYESNRIVMESEREARKESGGVSIRVGGETVPATKENRARQQQEKALGAEADRDGLRGAEKKQFIADGMQTRRNDSYQQDVDRIKDQLDISTAEADLELKRRKLLPEAPERPDPSKVSKFIDTASDLGLTYDAETGLFREDGTGTFTDDILNPSSPKYAQLQQMEGSEFFLQPPSDVMDNYEELTTIAKTDTNGYARVKADDGRIFKIYPDGNYEHTGYEKP